MKPTRAFKNHRPLNVVFINEDLTNAAPGLSYEVKQL